MATRPRILCLHGRQSNSEVSEMQMMVLGVDQIADCVFVDGPHQTARTFDKDLENGRSWFGEPSEGIRPALNVVLECVRKHGPFDGAFGFSQGASIVTLLSDPTILASLGVEPLWTFVILGCGNPQLALQQAEPALQLPLTIPSLHIHGAVDSLLPQSRALAQLYAQPHVLEHPFGHALPMSLCGPEHAALLRTVAAFVLSPTHPGRSR